MNCDTRLILKVDDSKTEDLLKFLRFQTHITKHCIMENHHITHKQKEEFKVKFV